MRRAVIVILGGLVLAGCGGPSEPAAGTPAAEGRPAPPPAHEPAANRRPGGAAKLIALPTNATSTTIDGQLDADTDVEFVLGEEQGALLLAHAVTPEADLDVSVYRGDTGDRVADQRPANPAFFVARLPETIGYLVVVHAKGTATPYSLELEGPRTLFFDAQGAAEVRVAAPAHSVTAYVVPPSESISAELTDGPADAYLTVQDFTGQLLLKAEPGSRSFSGAPADPKDSVIVRINQGAEDGEVTLKVQRK